MSKAYNEDDIRRMAGILSEDMDTKLDTFLENVDTIITTKVRGIVREELVEVKGNIKIIKAAVTDTNKQVQDHETRLVQLETA